MSRLRVVLGAVTPWRSPRAVGERYGVSHPSAIPCFRVSVEVCVSDWWICGEQQGVMSRLRVVLGGLTPCRSPRARWATNEKRVPEKFGNPF